MKRKLLPFLMVVLVAIMGSCVGDDIDDLQGQIDNLNDKVTELEQSQQAALLAAIADLQASIAALQTEMQAGDLDLAAQYDALLANLNLLEDEVANNAAAVYYGNLLTDADYEALVAQGATIVTGKAVVGSQSHIEALADVKMIGGDFGIEGGSTLVFETLQNVGGKVWVTGFDEQVNLSLPVLASVGSDFDVYENSGLTSITADALILVNGNFLSELNLALESIAFPMLDKIGGVMIDNYHPEGGPYGGPAKLASVDLSYADIYGDLTINVILGGVLHIGDVHGAVSIMSEGGSEGLSEIITDGTYFGSLELLNLETITKLDLNSLETIDGDVLIYGIGDYYDYSKLDFGTFEALTTINGDFNMGEIRSSSIEAFNNVTVCGQNISLMSLGSEILLLNVFNSLEHNNEVYSFKWYKIEIQGNIGWLDSFGALTHANKVSLNIDAPYDQNYQTISLVKFNGFTNLTHVPNLVINATKAMEFDAFNSVSHNLNSWEKVNAEIKMPSDTQVGMCSMQVLWDAYSADPSKYNLVFTDAMNWQATFTPEEGIARVTAPCNAPV